MRTGTLILSVLYLSAIAAALGYVSDWFSNPRALGEAFFVLPLVVAALALLVVILFAVGRKDSLWDVASLFIVLGSLAFVANEHHDRYGSWLPELMENRLVSSGDATLIAHGQTIHYRLELHYPGTVLHREYLVVTRAGAEQHVRLPLFNEKRGGYLSPKQPADWIVLRATPDPEIFEAETGRLLLTAKAFRINLQSGSAKTREPKGIAEIQRSTAK